MTYARPHHIPQIMGLVRYRTAFDAWESITGRSKPAHTWSQARRWAIGEALCHQSRLTSIILELDTPCGRVAWRGRLSGGAALIPWVASSSAECRAWAKRADGEVAWADWQTYQAQAVIYTTCADSAIWLVDLRGGSMLSYEVQRNDEQIDLIKDSLDAFWPFVTDDVPPPRTASECADTLDEIAAGLGEI